MKKITITQKNIKNTKNIENIGRGWRRQGKKCLLLEPEHT